MVLDLSILNNKQKEAVVSSPGPLLVLAGAGSGKTRVLSYRIAYIIEQGMIPASAVLALTFTNKAAREMRERVERLLVPLLQGHGELYGAMPTLTTFHSLGVKIIRRHGYMLGLPTSFAIIDNEDQLKVIKDVFTARNIDESLKPQAVLHFIHTVKNTGIAPEIVAQNYRGFLAQQFILCYQAYQVALHRQGSVDLDDLILLPVKLLSQFPEVRAFYQNLFRYILVDEYQDTNPIQYQFLRLLSPPAPLFVVGDDAQSIYSFRGSDVTNILNFERDFPDAQVVILDQNYRSTQNVLAVADAVLKHSSEQKPKVLWTENSKGQKVVIKELATEIEEASFIVDTIIGLASSKNDEQDSDSTEEVVYEEEQSEDRPFSVLDYMLGQGRGRQIVAHSARTLPSEHSSLDRFAVLYRTHAQSRAIESAFVAASIPYKIIGGVRFFDRKEVKDAIAYLRVLMNIRDTLALDRAFGVPTKGIGDKTSTIVTALVHSSYEERPSAEYFGVVENKVLIESVKDKLSGALPLKSRTAVGAFLSILLSLLTIPMDFALHDFIRRLIEDTGLLRYYKDGTEAGNARAENLMELVSLAEKFSSRPWQDALLDFLEEVALMSDVDMASEREDTVTLMTLHAAKGLEFDVVFFAGVEEGLLPHSRSMLDPKAFAEEVRLAYVGVTRARQQLYITYVRQRAIFGESRIAVPSRLLRSLPESTVEWRGRPRFLPTSTVHDGLEYEPFQD